MMKTFCVISVLSVLTSFSAFAGQGNFDCTVLEVNSREASTEFNLQSGSKIRGNYFRPKKHLTVGSKSFTENQMSDMTFNNAGTTGKLTFATGKTELWTLVIVFNGNFGRLENSEGQMAATAQCGWN